jgi:hypothetical protein
MARPYRHRRRDRAAAAPPQPGDGVGRAGDPHQRDPSRRPGGPAAQAGLLAGDPPLSLAGEDGASVKFEGADDLIRLLNGERIGRPTSFERVVAPVEIAKTLVLGTAKDLRLRPNTLLKR